MSCNKLTEIADEARAKHLNKNFYLDGLPNEYSQSHPNATQEVGTGDINNVKGKGTGVYFDTTNGGSEIDVNGLPSIPSSGRRGTFTNTYNANNEYKCILE